MKMTALESGQLWLMRLYAAGIAILLLIAAAVAETVLREKLAIARGLMVLPALLPVLWIVLVAPGRRFRAWGYRLTGEALELHHGVLTRIETLVPLHRVQHLDIAQGPIERACGVCRLVVHTAGTAHSRVTLPGLSRATAESMRDEIRAQIRSEE